MDTADTTSQHHDALHSHSEQFVSLLCGCESFVFQHEQTCRRIFAPSATAKRKPVHCSAMIARRFNDKNADMDFYAVSPPDYEAGGDSKREELCQQDPHTFTITATGASSRSGRATGSHDRSVKRWCEESLSSDEHWWRRSTISMWRL